MRTLLNLLLVIASVIGIADASYLTWVKLNNIVAPCSPFFKCETVLTSPWSSVGPVPLSLFGLLFYIVMLGLASTLLLERQTIKLFNRQFAISSLVLAWGTAGALFSGYLVFIMGVVLQAWCLYCLISAINCLVLFTLALFLHRMYHPKEIV